MAEEKMVFSIEADVKPAIKDIKDLNSELEEQKKILVELQREEIQLEQARSGMSDYEASIWVFL